MSAKLRRDSDEKAVRFARRHHPLLPGGEPRLRRPGDRVRRRILGQPHQRPAGRRPLRRLRDRRTLPGRADHPARHRHVAGLGFSLGSALERPLSDARSRGVFFADFWLNLVKYSLSPRRLPASLDIAVRRPYTGGRAFECLPVLVDNKASDALLFSTSATLDATRRRPYHAGSSEPFRTRTLTM